MTQRDLFGPDDDMKVTTLASWFGSDRMVADKIAEELRGLSWLGLPFAGGCSIVPHVDCRTIVVNDKHSHIINLATIAADATMGPMLYRRLRRHTFDPLTLANAQDYCRRVEPWIAEGVFTWANLIWAEAYFIAVWMGRSGNAGTDKEFAGKLSIRWTSSGGDSNTRFRSAVSSINAWRRTLRRCNFSTLDCFEFLDNCKDQDGHGCYVDAPWPDDGDYYVHRFSEADQRRLAARLREFKKTRVVIRYGAHPLIDELYPRSAWRWRELVSRTQGNNAKAEVLVCNHGPDASGK